MIAEVKKNSESGAVLIITVIIMVVAITFIAAMNNILAPMLHAEKGEELELQLQYLAEAGLAERLQQIAEDNIRLGSGEWQDFGAGEYKTNVSIAAGDYVYLSSTARIDDLTKTLTTKRKINKSELYFEDFSGVSPALNLAGEGYTKTSYNESQINDQFTIEAWIKLDEGIKDEKYILSAYNDIAWWEGDLAYSKPYSIYVEQQGNRINLIGEVETWINNGWFSSDEREYLAVEIENVEELADNQWVHIAFSVVEEVEYDFEGHQESEFELNLYVNGVKQNDNIYSTNEEQYLHTNYNDDIEKELLLGAGFTDAGNIIDNYWLGQIRDIRIWDRVRNETEIEKSMNKYLAGDEDGLITYYPVNDPIENSIAGGIADMAGDNNAIKEEATKYILTGDWTDTQYSSLENVMIEGDDNSTGGTALVVSDLIWYYKDELFEYYEDKLYKAEFRVKQEVNSETGTDYFYLGVEGLGGGDKLVDASGNESHEEQYYTALMYEEFTSEDGWQTFSGYFSGETRSSDDVYATVNNNNPYSTIIQNPMPLNRGVRNFRPVIIANYDAENSDDFGIAKIDYVKIEELEIEMGR